jgi:enoyl-CoA hydratase/carnithine racemase
VDSFDTLLYEEREGVAIVTLNRPEVHNAFDSHMRDELKALWLGLRRNDDVRVVVLTGAGEKAFCSGLDRAEMIEDFRALPTGTHKVGRVSTAFMFDDVGAWVNPKQNDLWKPVIAAVNGMACGGALYLLGESDIIIAAEHATFFDPHVTFGMVSGFEAVHLYQKLPLGETLRMALLGAHERMSAQRAHQVGLVSEVVPASDLMDRAMWVASVIASQPVLAVQGSVRAAWLATESGRRQALDQVSALVVLGTADSNILGGQSTFEGGRPEWQLR